jgi:nuclear pore complex protein Nup93
MTNNLKNLVQESRQLTNHILPTGLTPLERGLEQIEAQTKRLLKRTTSRQDSPQKVDNRTQYLLASRGIDSDKVLENLVDINLGLTFVQGVPDTDIEGYLRNEHETLVSLAIEETRNQAILDFETHFEQSLQRDWTKQKQRIMENFGHHSLTQMDVDLQNGGLQFSNGISGLVSAGMLYYKRTILTV